MSRGPEPPPGPSYYSILWALVQLLRPLPGALCVLGHLSLDPRNPGRDAQGQAQTICPNRHGPSFLATSPEFQVCLRPNLPGLSHHPQLTNGLPIPPASGQGQDRGGEAAPNSHQDHRTEPGTVPQSRGGELSSQHYGHYSTRAADGTRSRGPLGARGGVTGGRREGRERGRPRTLRPPLSSTLQNPGRAMTTPEAPGEVVLRPCLMDAGVHPSFCPLPGSLSSLMSLWQRWCPDPKGWKGPRWPPRT